jgi:hypothetical protein
MKRCSFVQAAAACLALALLSWHLSSAAQVIENPAKPRAKNAGRAVVPKEILAISDEGRSDFYFKWPGNLRVAPDGSLFVRDENQFLQFDKDGRFRRNLIFAHGGEIWAVTSTRDKATGVLIDVFDGDGTYQDSFYLKLPEAALDSLVSPSLSTLDGDFLYVVTKNVDEMSVIKKYLIEK